MADLKTVNNMALIIPLKMKNILDHLAKKPLEWTAFGEIEEVQNEDGMYFILNDIAFPKQENASSSTDVTDEDYAEFGEKLHKAKKDTSKYRIWIHSHNTMGAFWSGTDTAQMESFSTPNTTHRLALVVSSKDEWKACFNLHKPVRVDFDIPIIINDCITKQEVLDKYKSDLEALEEKKVYTTTNTSMGWGKWNSNTRSYEPQEKEEVQVEDCIPELDVYELKESVIANFDEIFWRLDEGISKKKIKKVKNYKQKYKDYEAIASYLSTFDLDYYKYCVEAYQQTPEQALVMVSERLRDAEYAMGNY